MFDMLISGISGRFARHRGGPGERQDRRRKTSRRFVAGAPGQWPVLTPQASRAARSSGPLGRDRFGRPGTAADGGHRYETKGASVLDAALMTELSRLKLPYAHTPLGCPM